VTGRRVATTVPSADLFVDAGFTAADALSRVALFASVDTAWQARVGGWPEWRLWVPGRLEVFGKHTDYAGGEALLAAVPRGFAVAARARDDQLIRVIDARYGGEVTVGIHGAPVAEHGWGRYVTAVATRLASNFPGASLGADVVLANDLPRAAGVSSSSAFTVGIASVLARRGDLETRDEWRHAIATPLDRATYFGCFENGASFRSLGGASGVGTEGGSEDHTAILLARPGCLSRFAFVPARALGEVPVPSQWTFVVAASGVHASKAGGVKDRFNRASRLARALLRIWTTRTGMDALSLAAALDSRPGADGELDEWLEADAALVGFSAGDLRRRLDHFVAETARAGQAEDAIRRADARALGELSDASQEAADTLLGNQVPETIALAKAAQATGALAATSFGAGFGGSVWALVEKTDAERFAREWMARYLVAHPQPSEPDWFVSPPSPPAMEI
jgi:galactokinase